MNASEEKQMFEQRLHINHPNLLSICRATKAAAIQIAKFTGQELYNQNPEQKRAC